MSATATKKTTAAKKTAAKKTEAKKTASSNGAGPVKDLSIILPGEPGHITVLGHDCTVRRIKSRELMFLFGILSTGLGDQLYDVKIDLDDEEEAKAQLTAILLAALPKAIPETMALFSQIVDPVDAEHSDVVLTEMRNPDPSILIDVIGVVVEQETEDFMSLVGKGKAWLERLKKTMPRRTGSSGRGRGRST